MKVEKVNMLILKLGGGSDVSGLKNERELVSTAAFNKADETVVIVSNMETPTGCHNVDTLSRTA